VGAFIATVVAAIKDEVVSIAIVTKLSCIFVIVFPYLGIGKGNHKGIASTPMNCTAWVSAEIFVLF